MRDLKETLVKKIDKVKKFFKSNKFSIKILIKEKRILIFTISIALICSIAIAVGVYSQVAKKKIINTKEKEGITEQLKNNFNDIFDNQLNEYIYLAYDIEDIKERKS